MNAPTTTQHCATCGGELIGAETGFGTCGHCGGRSLNPNRSSRRRQIAEIETSSAPDAEMVETIVSAYLEEGYLEVEVVPQPARPSSESGPWTSKVFASGNPYQEVAER